VTRWRANRGPKEVPLLCITHLRIPLAVVALASLGCGATRPRLDPGRPWDVAAEAINHVPVPIPVHAPKLYRPAVTEVTSVNPALREKVTLRSDSTDLRSLLLGLSKQTGLNIVLDEEVTGTVSAYLNDMEVLEALKRIVTPLGFALEVKDNTVRVYEPTVESRIYRVAYLRGERSGVSRVSMIDRSSSGSSPTGSTTGAGGATGGASPGGATTPGATGGAATGGSGGPGGTSLTEINSKFAVNFWEDLGAELESLIFEGARTEDLVRNDRHAAGISIYEKEESQDANEFGGNQPMAAVAPLKPGERAPQLTIDRHPRRPKARRSLTINSMAGTIVVRAKPGVLDSVGEYLAMIEETVQRQVVIDIRILEVSLSDETRFGIDTKDMPLLPSQIIQDNFSNFFGDGEAPRITTPLGFPEPTGQAAATDIGQFPALTQTTPSYGFVIGKTNAADGEYKAIVSALARLGDVKVVSAPKISALHNQKAIVKIVRDRVFFMLQAGSTALSAGGSVSQSSQFTPIVVPEGVVVDVTPLIGDDGSVTLEIHPSFSVIFNEKQAPQNQGSQPEVERREFQTTLHVMGEQTVVLGGLVTERTTRKESGLPYLKDIPYFGAIFRKTEEVVEKAELIVLLTPRVQGTPLAREWVNHQSKMSGSEPIPEAAAPAPTPGRAPAP
jgi:MSHA biogenesis protein MshL